MRVGEKISVEFITEFLLHHEFENVDFVAQAGEFSVRGGIVDIFSFAYELPYRIEFYGDDVESIRTFDPGTQLSVQAMNHITIMPNVQKKLMEESRSSFFDFIPSSAVVWFKDMNAAIAYIEQQLEKVKENIRETKTYSPDDLNLIFDSREELLGRLEKFPVVEFGRRFYYSTGESFSFSISPQPSFNKNFNLLIGNLQKNQEQGIKNILFADSPRQIERLYAIFEDLEKRHQIKNICIY